MKHACVSGNVDAARQILADHPDFADRPDHLGYTPLLYLIHGEQNNVDVARLLLDSGAIDIEREYRGRGEDAHRAFRILGVLCSSNDLCHGNNDQRRGLISLLLSRGADASRVASKPSGETPLHLTCGHNDIEVARLLVSHGAEVNATYSDDDISVLSVAIKGRSLPLIEYLISQGASIDLAPSIEVPKPLKTMMRPLHTAVIRGDLGIVEMLINRGAVVDRSSTRRMSALRHSFAQRTPRS